VELVVVKVDLHNKLSALAQTPHSTLRLVQEEAVVLPEQAVETQVAMPLQV